MVIKGSDLMAFMGGKSIAYATSHTLEMSMDTREISTKDGGGKWQDSEGGVISWTASSENLVGDPQAGIGYDELFDAMVAREPIDLVFAPEGDSTDYAGGKLDAAPNAGWTAKANMGRKGKALITSLSLNAPNGEHATMSVSFTGVGALTKVGNMVKGMGTVDAAPKVAPKA